MRLVDDLQEVPRPATTVYPYPEIAEAVTAGKIVALDAAEYNTSSHSIRSNVIRYAQRHQLDWQVVARGAAVYIMSPDS